MGRKVSCQSSGGSRGYGRAQSVQRLDKAFEGGKDWILDCGGYSKDHKASWLLTTYMDAISNV